MLLTAAHCDIATPRTVGIIGDPIDGTLSPTLHNALFKKLRLPYVYIPMRVAAAHLSSLIRVMRLVDLEGLNVTAPHKIAVLPLLDHLDAAAARIGAVNTILCRRHRTLGYNTDAPGFLAALRSQFQLDPRGLQVTLIGAGGTAQAIADALGQERIARLTILNRTPRHAAALQRRLRKHYRTLATTSERLTMPALRRAALASDLVVQTTSAPRAGRGALLWPHAVSSRAYVLDVRYGPGANLFLARAARAGLTVTDGTEILIQQAGLSFTLWTGRRPDLPLLRRIARRASGSTGHQTGGNLPYS